MSLPTTPTQPSRWPVVIVIAAALVGLAVRAYVVVQPPASSMLWDHHEYVRWGVLMHEEGLAALYDHPPHESLMWNRQYGAQGYGRHPEHFIRRVCNYPPLAGYLLYAEMQVLHGLDPSLTSNTVAARVVYALLSILGDGLIAVGCYAIVRRFAAPLAAAAAFAVILVAPPFILDSARWTQTDSWVLAPLIWMVWAMISRRWLTAGLLWGVALGLKTQAILFTPVWVFAGVLYSRRGEHAVPPSPERERGVAAPSLALRARIGWRQFLGGVLISQCWRIIAAVGLALLVLFVPAVPFTLHSGLKWFEESYTNNLFEIYNLTTLKAFNVWYVDLLLCDDLDASKKLLGLAKDTWGKLLLASAVLGAGVLIVRRREAYPAPMLSFTAAALLAAVMFPTRVHERYILLPIPFLVIAAMWHRRLWIALVPFLVVATAQMTALDWLGRSRGAGSWPDVLEWQKSRHLQRLTQEYEQLRAVLPREEFATLPPPEQQLEKTSREEYAKHRRAAAPWEWTVTVVELLSAGGVFVLLLHRAGRQYERSSAPSPSFSSS